MSDDGDDWDDGIEPEPPKHSPEARKATLSVKDPGRTARRVFLRQFSRQRAPALPPDLELIRPVAPAVDFLRSQGGDTYVKYDVDDGYTIFVRVRRSLLARYEAGQLNLPELVETAPDGWVRVELASDREMYVIPTRNLPAKWIPIGGAFEPFGPERRSGEQDMLISPVGGHGYETLSAIPRKYLQAHAFFALFGANGDPTRFTSHYRLEGGWSFHHLFERMRGSAPFRGDIVEASFASPGFLRFQVDPGSATDLRAAFNMYLRSRYGIRIDVSTLRSWYLDEPVDEDELDEDVEDALLGLAGGLNVDLDELVDRANGRVNAAKILVALVNRLEALARAHRNGEAVLVGVNDSEPE